MHDVPVVEGGGRDSDAEAFAVVDTLVGHMGEHNGCVVDVLHVQTEGAGGRGTLQVCGGDGDIQQTNIPVRRDTTESLGRSIKLEPVRQCGTVSHGSLIAQHITLIDVGEGAVRHTIAEGLIFQCAGIGQRYGHNWGIVGAGDADGQG